MSWNEWKRQSERERDRLNDWWLNMPFINKILSLQYHTIRVDCHRKMNIFHLKWSPIFCKQIRKTFHFRAEHFFITKIDDQICCNLSMTMHPNAHTAFLQQFWNLSARTAANWKVKTKLLLTLFICRASRVPLIEIHGKHDGPK